MDFSYSPKTQDLQTRLLRFMDEHVYPAEAAYQQELAANTQAGRRWTALQTIEQLKPRARAAGLWNLFLPVDSAAASGYAGAGLTNQEYAPLAEIMGRVPWASEVFNCSAPDTGNIELLQLFATPAQRAQWLLPLMEGTMRSCFAMSEPDVASSDPTNLGTRIARDGEHWVLNGRKWFITGAAHPQCRLAIVMGVSDAAPDAPAHRRHSLLLVPMDAPGLEIVRNIPVMQHQAIEGHCELVFRDVRVPASHLLGAAGEGFAMAQARLGPGRVHHCMRTIGQCELALELMAERALERMAFGRHLSDFANVQDWIAWSRLEIDQARLLVLRAAWRMDTEGNAAARTDVSAIKVVAAQLQTRVIDRAMQVFGAVGLTPDTPLAALWSWGRALRFMDGPDEVHLRAVAREELRRSRAHRGENVLHLQRWMPPESL